MSGLYEPSLATAATCIVVTMLFGELSTQIVVLIRLRPDLLCKHLQVFALSVPLLGRPIGNMAFDGGRQACRQVGRPVAAGEQLLQAFGPAG